MTAPRDGPRDDFAAFNPVFPLALSRSVTDIFSDNEIIVVPTIRVILRRLKAYR